MASVVVPITQGIRKSGSVNSPAAVTTSTVKIFPATAVAAGAIFDNFVVEQEVLLLPDTLVANGAIFDNFVVEISYILEPDTLAATAIIPVPFIPFQGTINPPTLLAAAVIPIPTIVFANDNSTAFPDTLSASVTIPFPELARTIQLHELKGDQIGFGLQPMCNVSIDRPETVERLIRNLRTVLINTEPYRLFDGRPVAIPKWDVRPTFVVSSVGHFVTDREDQLAVSTGADLRWIANFDTWDTDFGRWYPTDDGLATRYWWETNPEFTPLFHPGYTYYIAKEQFTFPTISFSEETFNHMWSSFDGNNSTSDSITIMMALVVNPVQRNQEYYTILDSGMAPPPEVANNTVELFDEVWYPPGYTVNRTRCRFFPHRVTVGFDGDQSTTSPDRTPSFGSVGILTLNFSKEDFYADWYSEEGKFSDFKTPVKALESQVGIIYHNFVLGRENGSLGQHDANMDIFEINLWTNSPSKEDLAFARKTLVGVYGVTN